jgi:NTE family protein
VGIAWESGLCAGLSERGVDLRECDAFVGTSAGAIHGVRLAGGEWPLGPEVLGAAEPLDPSKLELAALSQIFERWSGMQRANAADARAMGSLARNLYRDREDSWLQTISALAGRADWPGKPLFVTAVDTVSGERRVFDARSGVPIVQAVAASSAVPGIFASIAIGGQRYMDGQVLSSTHADILLEAKPREVVIAMPTNRHTAPLIGGLAEREAAAEIEALKAAGCRVHFVTPGAEHAARLGNNLMDALRVPDAHAVGVEQGRALAVHLA